MLIDQTQQWCTTELEVEPLEAALHVESWVLTQGAEVATEGRGRTSPQGGLPRSDLSLYI